MKVGQYLKRGFKASIDKVHDEMLFDAEALKKNHGLVDVPIWHDALQAIESDVRERRFIEHTLQLAIQAALDVASHIVSDDRLGEPRTNKDLFHTLAGAGWIESALADELRRTVSFRNVLVHGYTAVDPAVVRDVVENRLGDLESFVAAIRRKLAPA